MAAVAAASAAFTSFHVCRPGITFTRTSHRHVRKFISSSLSSTSITTTEFDITFAPPKPKPKPEPEPAGRGNTSSDIDSEGELGEQLYIPWIVRDENGNLTLQSTPPASLLHAVANAKTSKKKKKEKDVKAKAVATSIEPKFSKAARRYYNQNFRDPPQRLSKVLAAAGGKEAFNCFSYGSFTIAPLFYGCVWIYGK